MVSRKCYVIKPLIIVEYFLGYNYVGTISTNSLRLKWTGYSIRVIGRWSLINFVSMIRICVSIYKFYLILMCFYLWILIRILCRWQTKHNFLIWSSEIFLSGVVLRFLCLIYKGKVKIRSLGCRFISLWLCILYNSKRVKLKSKGIHSTILTLLL